MYICVTCSVTFFFCFFIAKMASNSGKTTQIILPISLRMKNTRRRLLVADEPHYVTKLFLNFKSKRFFTFSENKAQPHWGTYSHFQRPAFEIAQIRRNPDERDECNKIYKFPHFKIKIWIKVLVMLQLKINRQFVK